MTDTTCTICEEQKAPSNFPSNESICLHCLECIICSEQRAPSEFYPLPCCSNKRVCQGCVKRWTERSLNYNCRRRACCLMCAKDLQRADIKCIVTPKLYKEYVRLSTQFEERNSSGGELVGEGEQSIEPHCPKCRVVISKVSGCVHMTCKSITSPSTGVHLSLDTGTMCKTEFCYTCKAPWTKENEKRCACNPKASQRQLQRRAYNLRPRTMETTRLDVIGNGPSERRTVSQSTKLTNAGAIALALSFNNKQMAVDDIIKWIEKHELKSLLSPKWRSSIPVTPYHHGWFTLASGRIDLTEVGQEAAKRLIANIRANNDASHPLQKCTTVKELGIPRFRSALCFTQDGEMTDTSRRANETQFPSETWEILYRGKEMAQVHQDDFRRLGPEKKLNDNLLNFYFCWLRKNHVTPRIHVFNTYFYVNLANHGYESVSRWTKGIDLFTYDYIAVPMHSDEHWNMAIIYNLPSIIPIDAGHASNEGNSSKSTTNDLPKPTIISLDSLGGNDNCGLARSHLKDYICKALKEVRGMDVDIDKIDDIQASGIAQQRNDYDCGLHVIFYMAMLMKNPDEFIGSLRKLNEWDYEVDTERMRVDFQALLLEIYSEQELPKTIGDPANVKAKATTQATAVSLKKNTPLSPPSTASAPKGDDDVQTTDTAHPQGHRKRSLSPQIRKEAKRRRTEHAPRGEAKRHQTATNPIKFDEVHSTSERSTTDQVPDAAQEAAAASPRLRGHTEKVSDHEINVFLELITVRKSRAISSYASKSKDAWEHAKVEVALKSKDDWEHAEVEVAYIPLNVPGVHWFLGKICKDPNSFKFQTWDSNLISREAVGCMRRTLESRLGIMLTDPKDLGGGSAEVGYDSGIYAMVIALCDVLGQPAPTFVYTPWWRAILRNIWESQSKW